MNDVLAPIVDGILGVFSGNVEHGGVGAVGRGAVERRALGDVGPGDRIHRQESGEGITGEAQEVEVL